MIWYTQIIKESERHRIVAQIANLMGPQGLGIKTSALRLLDMLRIKSVLMIGSLPILHSCETAWFSTEVYGDMLRKVRLLSCAYHG